MLQSAREQISDAPFLQRGRIPSLDGLRAVAICAVLLCHVHNTYGFFAIPHKAHVLLGFGALGVEFFFVISGFLITTLLCREIDRTTRVNIKHFYLRRVLRIIPAYTALLAVVAGMQYAGLFQVPSRDWLAALTYTINFRAHPAWQLGHAWSLSIEEHFYLLWPMVMAVGGLMIARRSAFGVIVFCFLARWVVLLKFKAFTPASQTWTVTRIDMIAFGCLLALLARDEKWRAKLDRFISGSRPWLYIAGIFVGIALSFVSGKFEVGINYTLMGICMTMLTWAAMRKTQSAFVKVLNSPLAIAIGVGSYSLYLWQQLFLDRTRDSVMTRFPQNIVFAFIAAAVSYHLIEKPFLRLKDRLEDRPASVPAPAPTSEPATV